jgi:hypothetical protein
LLLFVFLFNLMLCSWISLFIPFCSYSLLGRGELDRHCRELVHQDTTADQRPLDDLLPLESAGRLIPDRIIYLLLHSCSFFFVACLSLFLVSLFITL